MVRKQNRILLGIPTCVLLVNFSIAKEGIVPTVHGETFIRCSKSTIVLAYRVVSGNIGQLLDKYLV